MHPSRVRWEMRGGEMVGFRAAFLACGVFCLRGESEQRAGLHRQEKRLKRFVKRRNQYSIRFT